MTTTKADRQLRGEVLLFSSGGGWTSDGDSALRMENPSFYVISQGGRTYLQKAGRRTVINSEPMDFLDEMLGQGYLSVGYLGYEFFSYINSEFMPSPTKVGGGFPDAAFLFFEEDEISQEKIDILGHDRGVKPFSLCPSPNMSKDYFVGIVNKARQYIAEGDIYQVNLSQMFKVPFEIDPEQFLLKLYGAQPVPFACCIDFGDFQLLSGSMELFLQRSGRRIVTRPIKGTRRRGRDKKEDSVMRDELLGSPKETAENLMIVDLMRNDLGRVCEFGSVRVNKLFDVEAYTTLFQMVSEVEGRLRDDVSLNQIIMNTFPPGSVTGAPKQRAMEIIDELEPHLRGPYCGAIGLFMPGGDFTMSVAIRVLAASRGKGKFWVGGGIMWDSVPEQEYEETLVKAEAIMRALR